MKERKMSKTAIENAIKDVVETHEEFFIGTAGVSIMSGAIISKIDTVICEMGFAEKAETKCFEGEWYIVRKYHN
jgi:hypothetical protein